jgi:hypothetical protein
MLRAWWGTPIIIAPRWLRQKDCEVQASLDYIDHVAKQKDFQNQKNQKTGTIFMESKYCSYSTENFFRG